MKRIWITGSSGSGKTTYATRIGNKLNIPIYHRDHITWQENWKERSDTDQIEIVREISQMDRWVFDGNRFSASKLDGRFENCDVLIHLSRNRFTCFFRALKRYFENRNSPRKDLPEGCKEEFDWTLCKYILFQYPKQKKQRELFFDDLKMARNEVTVLKRRREINKWLKENNI